MNSNDKHVKLNNRPKKSTDSQLYKRMYIFPENHLNKFGGKKTPALNDKKNNIIPSSFRNVENYPTPIDLEKKTHPVDHNKEKKPCHVCKKKPLKKEKKINLSKKTRDKAKLKRKKKKSIEHAKFGKLSLLNKKDLLSKISKDGPDKSLKSISLQNASKHVPQLNPNTLKFNSIKDFHTFFNKIYQHILDKSTSRKDKVNSYLQLFELFKSLEKQNVSNKNDLTQVFAEKMRRATDLVNAQQVPHAEETLDNSIIQQKDLEWDPMIETPEAVVHENILSDVYTGFLQDLASENPHIKDAIKDKLQTIDSKTPQSLSGPYRTPIRRSTHNKSRRSRNFKRKTVVESTPNKIVVDVFSPKKTSLLQQQIQPALIPSKNITSVKSPQLDLREQELASISIRPKIGRSPPEKGLALRQQELEASAAIRNEQSPKPTGAKKKKWSSETLGRRERIETRSQVKKDNKR